MFNAHYDSKGWILRKVQILYKIAWTGVVRSICHLSLSIILHLGILLLKKLEVLLDDQNEILQFYSRKNLYATGRDLQEAFGWSLMLFSDRLGSYHIQEARFYQCCYESIWQNKREAFGLPMKKAPQKIQYYDLESLLGGSTEEIDPILKEVADIPNKTARITAAVIKRGYYINSLGEKKAVRSGEALLQETSIFQNRILENPIPPKYDHSEIKITPLDSLTAAQSLLQEGKATNVAVLVFASPTEAGGGMRDSNNGQEEEVSRRSSIFEALDRIALFHPSTIEKGFYPLVSLYPADEQNPNYEQMEKNQMLHVPRVTVFRTSNDQASKMLEEPFEVGMLISPPLNKPDFEKRENDFFYKRKEDEEQLYKVIMTQLQVAAHNGYDSVVLGAFGCGAFENPPDLMARAYRNIIHSHFEGVFKTIVFAVLDDNVKGRHNPEGNIKPFERCFGKKSYESLQDKANIAGPSRNIDSTWRPNGEIVNVVASMAGNPPHPGHIGMIAQGIKRLQHEGYQIGQLIVHWDDEYLKNKVMDSNDIIYQQHEREGKSRMYRVLLPRETRIGFINHLINDAKNKGQLDQHLKIRFCHSSSIPKTAKKTFKILGADLPRPSKEFVTDPQFKYCVIVSRNGVSCEDIEERSTKKQSILKSTMRRKQTVTLLRKFRMEIMSYCRNLSERDFGVSTKRLRKLPY
jgi:uncharacterized protein (TIGR02452 family)